MKILYSLPLNSFTLVSDNENNIYLIKIKSSTKNKFNKDDQNYLTFINIMNTNTQKSILKSYDLFLNNKYKIDLNKKTIERIENYFK